MKRHGGTERRVTEWRKPIWECSTQDNSKGTNVTVWKWQNYGDSKQSSVCLPEGETEKDAQADH